MALDVPILDKYERIVIKIGSSLLADDETGELKATWVSALVDDVVELKKKGKEVIIVSSGAVAIGRSYLDIPVTQPVSLEEKQAAAACGQSELIQYYRTLFGRSGTKVAQVLLALSDTEQRRRYMNANNTLQTLLDYGIVPVINENDALATAELRFGDNDRLAARVAQMTDSDVLVLLSDVDGLYDANPHKDPEAVHIPLITKIDDNLRALAQDATSPFGTGGMTTKVMAAEMLIDSGTDMIICDGRILHPLTAIQKGGRHSLFKASQSVLSAKKQWLQHSLKIEGKLIIDNGAVRALKEGNSLLAVGIASIEGEFDRGDAVEVIGADGEQIAIGLVGYNSSETMIIKGLNTKQIASQLPHLPQAALIHRDNLVVTCDKL